MEEFGSSGVRGVAGKKMTPQFVASVTAAAGTVLDAAAFGVTRDTRTTGRMFADAAASALASIGCDVHRLGILPTPAAQAYAAREGIPVVVITASHNPPEYNGVKLVGNDGIELPRPVLEQIETRLNQDNFERVGYDAVGGHHDVEAVDRMYVRELLKTLQARGVRDRVANADLTIAVDPGHGAGSLTSPRFFRELGCQVLSVNAQPDGQFPGRDPEPVADNLDDLRRLVRSTDADLGVAHDGDADRSIFVDELGHHIAGDAALAALAAPELETGDVAVSAVNVSQRLVDTVNAAGASLELTPIGSTYLVTRIQDLLADGYTVPVAGEGNGGILFPEYRITRDGAYTAGKFLDLIVERPASEVIEDHSGYANVRVNLEYETPTERDEMLAAAEAHARQEDATLSTIDGYRLDYGDGWVLVRPSGTEPLVRLAAEARTQSRAKTLLDGMRNAISNPATGTSTNL